MSPTPSLPISPDIAELLPTGRPPQKAQEAASEFEAFFVAQLLKSARSEGGWLGSGEDSTSSSVIELAEQQLATLLSKQGGLGLAKLLVQGLHSEEASNGSASQPAAPQPGDTPASL